MGKKRILIASVLKPVTDTRMFEKIGLSLSKLPDSEIHIFGIGEQPDPHPLIQFHPVLPFQRLGFERLKTQLKFFKTLLKVKPEVTIVNTFELLLVTILYKILFNVKIVYDIRENYLKNILYQPTFPEYIKGLIGYSVRLIEIIASPFISCFWLAEKAYAAELPFLKDRFIILENKFQPPATYSPPPTPKRIGSGKIRLLYSGTIAEVYGIYEAITLTGKLYALNDQITLTIIGFSPLKGTLKEVQRMIADKPYITLTGGETLVPHSRILSAIQNSDIGLLPYQPNPSTFNCIPTKIYEYLAFALPVLIQENPAWSWVAGQADAGISIDFRKPEPAEVLDFLLSRSFFKNGVQPDIFWQNEEEKLYRYFETLT